MKGYRRNESGSVNWGMVGALAAIAGVVVAVLIARGVFSPSPSTSTTRTSRTNPVLTSSTTKGPSTTSNAPTTPGGEAPVWQSEVSLVVNQEYALDGPPIEALNSCSGCLKVGDYPGAGLAIQADNGLQPWTKTGRPSHADCVQLLSSGTGPAAALETSDQSGISIGGWVCAFSKAGDVLRLRYEGSSRDGTNYRFAVTAWRNRSSPL